MAIPATLAMVPLSLLFFGSGLIVNLFQVMLFIIVRPSSRSMYKRINKIIVELLWLELIWLVDWWACIKVNLYADKETLELMGKENAILISNHRGDIDWLIGWVMAQVNSRPVMGLFFGAMDVTGSIDKRRAGCIGSVIAIMKKEAKYLPVLGWSMWFSDFIFLEGNWSKDEDTLKVGFKKLEDFSTIFWLVLFVEGARFNQKKLEAAQAYAVSKGLPSPRNVLIPRTKGFVSAISHIRSFVPAIYDCTVAFPKTKPPPTMLGIFSGQPIVVNLQIRRYKMNELPENEDGIAQWCKDLFIAKDVQLERFFTNGTFSDLDLQQIGRPIKSLLVVVSWFCLIGCAIFKLFQRFSWVASWEVVCSSIFFYACTIIMIQICFQSFESGHIDRAKRVE